MMTVLNVHSSIHGTGDNAENHGVTARLVMALLKRLIRAIERQCYFIERPENDVCAIYQLVQQHPAPLLKPSPSHNM